MNDEEIPIELYKKTNNEFVKYVRYDDYKKLENIIKEVREYIENEYLSDGEMVNILAQQSLLEILDKGEKE